jgi:hypothetical protein
VQAFAIGFQVTFVERFVLRVTVPALRKRAEPRVGIGLAI